jgi:hypothetical protein
MCTTLPPEQTSFKAYTFYHIGEGGYAGEKERGGLEQESKDSGGNVLGAGLIEELILEEIFHAKTL